MAAWDEHVKKSLEMRGIVQELTMAKGLATERMRSGSLRADECDDPEAFLAQEKTRMRATYEWMDLANREDRARAAMVEATQAAFDAFANEVGISWGL